MFWFWAFLHVVGCVGLVVIQEKAVTQTSDILQAAFVFVLGAVGMSNEVADLLLALASA